jgi:sterol desaturase/sphingolipid hydroxylase (fatty acid hydroxylase superfamily)
VKAWLSDWAVLSPLIITVWAWTLIGLERRFPYDRGQKLFRRGWFDDFFLYTLVQSYLLGLIIEGLIRWMDAQSGLSRLRLVSDWPVWAQLGVFFITHDLYIYWFHRLQHRSALLWRTHEAHHSVRDVDWLAGSRSHPIEILVNQTIEFAPILLLGAAPELALMKGTLDAVWGMWIHSNVGVRSGPLQYLINGPEMHRWHHSRQYRGYGCNFATKLAIWDWLFGTAHLPPEKPPGYGLDDPRYPEGYLAQTLYAFRLPARSTGAAREGASSD